MTGGVEPVSVAADGLGDAGWSGAGEAPVVASAIAAPGAIPVATKEIGRAVAMDSASVAKPRIDRIATGIIDHLVVSGMAGGSRGAQSHCPDLAAIVATRTGMASHALVGFG